MFRRKNSARNEVCFGVLLSRRDFSAGRAGGQRHVEHVKQVRQAEGVEWRCRRLLLVAGSDNPDLRIPQIRSWTSFPHPRTTDEGLPRVCRNVRICMWQLFAINNFISNKNTISTGFLFWHRPPKKLKLKQKTQGKISASRSHLTPICKNSRKNPHLLAKFPGVHLNIKPK